MEAVFTMCDVQAARLGLEHAGDEVAEPVDHPHQVHAQHPAPLLLARLPDVAASSHAGVVDEESHVAGLPEGAPGEAGHLGVVRHVDHLGERETPGGPDLPDDPGEGTRLHVGEDEAHAQGMGAARHLQPEAAPGPGDHGGPSGEVSHGPGRISRAGLAPL